MQLYVAGFDFWVGNLGRKYVCSCGAPQYQGESVVLSRSEYKNGLNHEFEETFTVWICEFCGEKKNVLAKATRKSKGNR